MCACMCRRGAETGKPAGEGREKEGKLYAGVRKIDNFNLSANTCD